MLTTLIIMTFLLGFLTGALCLWYIAYHYNDKLETAGIYTMSPDAKMKKHEDEAIAMTQDKLGGTILS